MARRCSRSSALWCVATAARFGSFPVVAFSLAGSFAIYGLLRKKLPIESLPGLLLEALILLPVALIYWWLMTPSQALI